MPQGAERHHIGAYIILLAIVVVLGALLYLFGIGKAVPASMQQAQIPGKTIAEAFPPGTPAPTAADYVTAQQGFEDLVQYTDSGFHPITLTIKKGETVRFTNISSAAVTVATDGTQSPALNHGEYWEHTFAKSGSSQYTNGAGNTGSITIK